LNACDTAITPETLGPDLDTSNPDNPNNDFGFDDLLALGDYVWYDTNQDGIQDVGEPGVNGVTVNLYDNATCSAPIFSTTETLNGGLPAADGFYFFSDLDAGSYCVEFTDIPVNYQFTVQNTPNDALDSDADPLNGQVQNIDLTAVDPSIDAGIFLNGSISGVTWCESTTNANTSYDPGDSDTLLPNIQVTLYEDANCSDTVDGSDATTAVSMDTNASGAYLFSNLPVGPVGNALCYITEVDVNDTDLNACDTAITPETLGPDLDTSNPDNPNNDFGFDDLLALGDYVWYDNNQNGLQDAGEPGVNGVTVNLYDNATCTAPVLDSEITANGGVPATDGYYYFPDLDAGSYCVEFMDLPVDFVITDQNVSGDDSVDSDGDPVTGQVQNINLTAVDPTIDLGVYAPIGSVSGQIFCDDNPQNGVNDAGEEISGVLISLYRDMTCDGNGLQLIDSQNTGLAGDFLFGNLPVALSPAPPNPEVCYVMDFDSNDPALGECNIPITPDSETVMLDTDNPDAPPVEFGVIPPAEPIPVPLNSNLALLILLAILGGVGLYSRRRKLLS
ncbi:SdrD B-like domain-containing protein, partial [Marinicella litoralis]|uniref:SdrD B-like domain-containing protein n=1 Tax=Marinicella litoralis TaxID=644220 RepID=UPI0024830AF7